MPTIAKIGPYRIYFVSHDIAEPPHVHVDLMNRAAASGATAVLARGAFAARMPAILSDLAARGRAPESQMQD